MDYSKRGVKNKRKMLNAKGGKFGRKFLVLVVKLALAAVIALGVWGASLGIGVFKSVLAGTPEIYISDVVATAQATIVYDKNGNQIDEFVGMDSNRIEVTWDEIPKQLGLAFVASEDERFYQHNGIDYKGLVRAAYEFIRTKGKVKQGASTITQQLLKNTVFTEWTEEDGNLIKQLKRKIQEQYLALEVTKKTEKDDILLRYMNAINLGQNTLGVESASQRYFGKSAIDLNLSECAVIAGITQNPSRYNPISHPDKNAERRERCLNIMKDLEFITQEEYDEAMADTDDVYERISYHNTNLLTETGNSASYFTDSVYEMVLEDLMELGYDKTNATRMLTSGGLRIYTTMDPEIQKIMDEELKNEENFPEKTYWYLDYALSIYDAKGEANNFSKENMTTYFKEHDLRAEYPDFYYRDKQKGSTSFRLLFPSQEALYEAIDVYRAAMFEELGITQTDDNYVESISMTVQPQVAMVVEDQETGYVVALAGGRGAKEGRRTLNRATDAKRSPGSIFKVLASFAPAIDTGMKTLASVYNDLPFNYTDGTPIKNWYTGYGNYGTICSIRTGIVRSLNIIAVKNLTVIGPRVGYDYLEDFGFTTITDGVWIGDKMFSDVSQSLALGGLTFGVTPYEVNAAYAAIANGGVYNKPTLYTLVTDADGNVILDHQTTENHRVLKETTAFLVTSAMEDCVNAGTGYLAKFGGMSIAGKTGTSSDDWDLWFAGYTPYYTATVWNGYDNNAYQTSDEQVIAKKVWRSVMSRIHETLPNEPFEKPAEGIVQCAICSQSGKLPVPGLCDECVRTEYFEEGTEPTEYCTIHYQGNICAYDGKIATEQCPFAVPGTVILPLPEEPELIQGSTMIVENADGTQTLVTPMTTSYCQHDALFFANPDYQALLEQQQAEINARNPVPAENQDDD